MVHLDNPRGGVDAPDRVRDEWHEHTVVADLEEVAGRGRDDAPDLAESLDAAPDEVRRAVLALSQRLLVRHYEGLAAKAGGRVPILDAAKTHERPLGRPRPALHDRRSAGHVERRPLRERVVRALDPEGPVEPVRAAHTPYDALRGSEGQSTTSTSTRRPWRPAQARITVRSAATVRPPRPITLPISSSAT